MTIVTLYEDSDGFPQEPSWAKAGRVYTAVRANGKRLKVKGVERDGRVVLVKVA